MCSQGIQTADTSHVREPVRKPPQPTGARDITLGCRNTREHCLCACTAAGGKSRAGQETNLSSKQKVHGPWRSA